MTAKKNRSATTPKRFLYSSVWPAPLGIRKVYGHCPFLVHWTIPGMDDSQPLMDHKYIWVNISG